jgi:hypothetical protein
MNYDDIKLKMNIEPLDIIFLIILSIFCIMLMVICIKKELCCKREVRYEVINI